MGDPAKEETTQPTWTVVRRLRYLAGLFGVPNSGQYAHDWRAAAARSARHEEALERIADFSNSAHEAQEIAREALGG